MLAWISEIRWRKVTGAALIFTIVVTAVQQIEALLTMRFYTDPFSSGLLNTSFMTQTGQKSGGMFFGITVFFTFITGIVLATLYDFLRPLLSGGYWRRVYRFSDIVIGLFVVLWCMPTFLLFSIPLSLLALRTAFGLVSIVIAAIVFARFLHHGK